MAPNDDMSDRIDQNAQLISEHGNRLDNVEARQNSQGVRLERFDQILLGDPQIGFPGVVTKLEEISEQLQDISEWRAQIIAYGSVITTAVKIVVGLLGMIGFGVWWPELVELWHMLMGR